MRSCFFAECNRIYRLIDDVSGFLLVGIIGGDVRPIRRIARAMSNLDRAVPINSRCALMYIIIMPVKLLQLFSGFAVFGLYAIGPRIPGNSFEDI